MANEAELFPFIQSCSIACGGHVGSRESISETMHKAKQFGVKVGAHPSYPDPQNFGRVSLQMQKDEFQECIRNQMNLYFECLEDTELSNFHIKAHGALYNDLCKKESLCEWYLDVVNNFEFQFLYAPFNSVLAAKAIELGVNVLSEAFLDRRYTRDGYLVSRLQESAVIESAQAVWEQFELMLYQQKVQTIEGDKINLQADTYCVHGDHPNAIQILTFINQQLKARG